VEEEGVEKRRESESKEPRTINKEKQREQKVGGGGKKETPKPNSSVFHIPDMFFTKLS